VERNQTDTTHAPVLAEVSNHRKKADSFATLSNASVGMARSPSMSHLFAKSTVGTPVPVAALPATPTCSSSSFFHRLGASKLTHVGREVKEKAFRNAPSLLRQERQGQARRAAAAHQFSPFLLMSWTTIAPTAPLKYTCGVHTADHPSRRTYYMRRDAHGRSHGSHAPSSCCQSVLGLQCPTVAAG
jgi:hypothetical protein